MVPQDVDQGNLVEQVPGHQFEPVLNMCDPLEVEGARPPDHADDLVALLQEEFGQIRAILPGHPSDQRPLCHWMTTLADPQPTHAAYSAAPCRLPRFSHSGWVGATASRSKRRNGPVRCSTLAGTFSRSLVRVPSTSDSRA